MANLTETNTWESGVYQLEKTDPVVAGLDGIANRQAQQLANRTNYLKTEQDKLKTATEAASTAKSGTTQLSSSVTDENEMKAATTKAVKIAMDRANEAHTLATGKAPLDSPALTGEPTAPTAAQTVNNTQIATTAFVKTAIAELVGGAPAQLDTLKEIATALGDNANLNTTLLAEIGKKANATDVATKDHLIGIPLPYPKAQVPTGFLAMNGQAISQITYPKLFALYGAHLPDLRGEFIRGWDNGRGIDSGRGILSAQGDAIRNITGFGQYFTAEGSNSGGGALAISTQMSSGRAAGAGGVGLKLDFDASRVVPTASENRPRNVAFQYICLAG